jgi:hypothetical protein
VTRQVFGARILLAALVVLCAGSLCRADDLNRPDWWDFSRTDNTYQLWEFYTPAETPAPDGGKNVFGFLPATIRPNPSLDPSWLPTMSSAPDKSNALGVWNLAGAGSMTIPVNDDPTPRSLKRLWVQMTWLPINPGAAPVLTAWAADSGYAVSPVAERPDDRLILPNGWIHSTFEMSISPSPASQTLQVGGDIYLDEIVVDTYSTTPEPATLGLLALGLLGLGRRRR